MLKQFELVREVQPRPKRFFSLQKIGKKGEKEKRSQQSIYRKGEALGTRLNNIKATTVVT